MLKDSKGAFVGKKPNKYKMNIEEVASSSLLDVEIEELNYKDSLKVVISALFDKSELKKTLPRRQYEQLRGS